MKTYTCSRCGAQNAGLLANWAHDAEHAQEAKLRQRQARHLPTDRQVFENRNKPVFSQAVSDGKCPKCGGTQFKAKRPIGRTVGWALMAGPAAVAVRRTQVRCVTCGEIYVRG